MPIALHRHPISWCSGSNSTACPVLALPGGFTADGLPVGLQVAGPLRSEAQLFSYGAYLEQLFGLAGRLPIDPVSR